MKNKRAYFILLGIEIHILFVTHTQRYTAEHAAKSFTPDGVEWKTRIKKWNKNRSIKRKRIMWLTKRKKYIGNIIKNTYSNQA